MSWASGRRALIIGIVAVVLLLIAGGIAYNLFHQAPSCTDQKQNQDEEGIDCGGICTYLCSETIGKPIVRFARELRQGGRTDVIAYIENPNTAAARAVSYTVEVYGADYTVLAKKTGTVDLPPRDYGVVPVYLPGVYSGDVEATQAFLSFDDATFSWFIPRATYIVPVVDSPELEGTFEAPRVAVRVTNPSVETIRNMKMIATVFDVEGNAMASSQTVLPDVGPRGNAQAIFTWKEAFPSTVARIDVRPVISVPAP